MAMVSYLFTYNMLRGLSRFFAGVGVGSVVAFHFIRREMLEGAAETDKKLEDLRQQVIQMHLPQK